MEKATIYDYARMCKNMKNNCEDCQLGVNRNGTGISCSYLVRDIPDIANEIILKWCEENPVKTRQDEFLKLFPDVDLDDNNVIRISPCLLEKRMYSGGSDCAEILHDVENCDDCRRKYWMEEVKE